MQTALQTKSRLQPKQIIDLETSRHIAGIEYSFYESMTSPEREKGLIPYYKLQMWALDTGRLEQIIDWQNNGEHRQMEIAIQFDELLENESELIRSYLNENS